MPQSIKKKNAIVIKKSSLKEKSKNTSALKRKKSIKRTKKNAIEIH